MVLHVFSIICILKTCIYLLYVAFRPWVGNNRNCCWWNFCSVNMCVCSITKSCLIPCDPMECSPLGSSVHGIFQARILEWIAISSSRVSSQPRNPALHLLHWQADYHWATWEAPGDPLSNGEKDFLRKGFSRGQEKGPNGVKIFLWRKEGRIPGKWN